ncbi:MAG TPA: hypothetical protein VMS63_06870 [Gaiellaceae bacterium]|nr:hypothetical protein [Gaiellaceae bacterium]
MTTSRAQIVAATLLAGAVVGGGAASIAARPAARDAHHVSRTPTWPPLATAGPFLLESIRDKVDGRWDRAWRSLFPLHRLAVPEATYARCEAATPFAAPLDSIRVVNIRRSPVRVPGLARPVPGVAVTVHVELSWYGPRDPITLTPSFHLVPVRGHWTWLLSAERYELYVREGCSTMPAA